jgi:hypothetical protein
VTGAAIAGAASTGGHYVGYGFGITSLGLEFRVCGFGYEVNG